MLQVVYAFITITMTVICFFTFITNSIVILAILRESHRKDFNSSLFTTNLCAVGILGSFTVLPIGTANFVASAQIGHQSWCNAIGPIGSTVLYENIYAVCLLSAERYFSIAHPMTHSVYLTFSTTLLCLGCSWFVSAFLAILPLLGWGSYDYDPLRYQCFYKLNKENGSRTYVITMAILVFVISSTIVFITYAAIFIVARTVKKHICILSRGMCKVAVLQPAKVNTNEIVPCDSEEYRNTENIQRVRIETLDMHLRRPPPSISKAAITLGLITGTFILFFAPEFLLQVISVWKGSSHSVSLVTLWMTYTSLATNPLIYGCMNKEIKTLIQKVGKDLEKWWKKNKKIERASMNAGLEQEESFMQYMDRKKDEYNKPTCKLT